MLSLSAGIPSSAEAAMCCHFSTFLFNTYVTFSRYGEKLDFCVCDHCAIKFKPAVPIAQLRDRISCSATIPREGKLP